MCSMCICGGVEGAMSGRRGRRIQVVVTAVVGGSTPAMLNEGGGRDVRLWSGFDCDDGGVVESRRRQGNAGRDERGDGICGGAAIAARRGRVGRRGAASESWFRRTKRRGSDLKSKGVSLIEILV